jgi:DNA repair exonuclease SbcCD ATPase subunit
MLVTVEFSSNGTEYKIERGRKPNLLRFFVNNIASSAEEDTAQGENKETQVKIEQAIGMSSDMFKHIVALNTYSEPFLALASGEQRKIIEQLLGITLLSEKAERIKEKIRENKDNIQLEEFRIKAIEEANKRVQEQIESLKRRQTLWLKKHQEDLNKLVSYYDELSKIDIDAELQAHRALVLYNENRRKKEMRDALLARQTAWHQKRAADLTVLQQSYDTLSHIDIAAELQAHVDLVAYNLQSTELAKINAAGAALDVSIAKEQKTIDKLENEVKTLESNRCYTCGQDFHTDNHTQVLENKHNLLAAAHADLAQFQIELEQNKSSVFILGKRPVTYYKTESQAVKHGSELANIQNQITAKHTEHDPYADQLAEHTDIVLGAMPSTHYDTEAEAVEHRTTVASLLQQIATKAAEVDPYAEQRSEMESKALQEIDFNRINELTRTGDHLKFLLDLLTSKDSFVRKKIIDQNLSYLNARLTSYLDKIGLPHTVVFKNDLSVEITELGRELDFDNLSRGERNRLILGLSFAFRDVWENLYFPINTLFIDELIDSGLDSIGVENAMAILKDMSRRRNKSIWLVSHREELAGRVPSVLKVVKEGGFTSYSTAAELA